MSRATLEPRDQIRALFELAGSGFGFAWGGAARRRERDVGP